MVQDESYPKRPFHAGMLGQHLRLQHQIVIEEQDSLTAGFAQPGETALVRTGVGSSADQSYRENKAVVNH
jgi:hypothetical protein